MINAFILASGSKGNATLVFNEDTTILIDLGISKKELCFKLSELNKKLADIDYFFFTHSHSDHIKSYEVVPIEKRFALRNVVELMKGHELKYFNEYNFGSLVVIPIKASHDAGPTCGYLIKDKDEELVYLTDTGMIPKRTLSFIENKDFYIIESNYDFDMLFNSSRPEFLKARIDSTKGHLSNEDSAFYMANLIGDKTKKIVLAHLSEECNTPEKALETYDDVFLKNGLIIDQFDIKCANQWETVQL